MQARGPAGIQDALQALLDRFELQASAEELAVIEAVDSIYAGVILALMDEDLSGVESERDLDLSHGPTR